jgi:hypothetical protein
MNAQPKLEWKCLGCECENKDTKHMIALDDANFRGICSECIVQMVTLIAMKERTGRIVSNSSKYLKIIK